MGNETLPDTARDEILSLYDEIQDVLEVDDSSGENDFLTYVAKRLHHILFFRLEETLTGPEVWESDVDVPEGPLFEMYSEEGDDAVFSMLMHLREDVVARNVVADFLQQGIDQVGNAHPEVYDIEPQIAIADWVNEHICLPQGWEPFLLEEI